MPNNYTFLKSILKVTFFLCLFHALRTSYFVVFTFFYTLSALHITFIWQKLLSEGTRDRDFSFSLLPPVKT